MFQWERDRSSKREEKEKKMNQWEERESENKKQEKRGIASLKLLIVALKKKNNFGVFSVDNCAEKKNRLF